jgi:membrane protein implicated in regulation of membrane protease activity
MTWADMYLICFIVGFALSAFSVLSGLVDFHVPGFDHGHFHVGDTQVNGHASATHVSPFNFPTMAAFLAWFGGVGFLLTRFSGLWFWLAFLLALLGGGVGASIVFLFFAKVLLANERPLDPADFDMIGVLGKLTSGIREDGIGEMSYTQAGARRSVPARSGDGGVIPKGTDVLVTRYEKGVAYVRRWDDPIDS